MSIQAVKKYYSELEKIIDYGGSTKETAIRTSFYNLLNEYASQKGLMLIPELTIKAPSGKNITPDGTLKDSLRLDWGYWESKDTAESNPVLDRFLHSRNIIKWSKMIKRDKLRKGKKGSYTDNDLKKTLYRPYTKYNLYYSYIAIDLKADFGSIFPIDNIDNKVINFSGLGFSSPFQCLATNVISSLDFLEKTKCLPLYRYDTDGNRIDNITDWGLEQFRERYEGRGTWKKKAMFHK